MSPVHVSRHKQRKRKLGNAYLFVKFGHDFRIQVNEGVEFHWNYMSSLCINKFP